MTVFAVRLTVLLALYADPSWRARLDNARGVAELQAVIVEFGRAKGFEVAEVPLK